MRSIALVLGALCAVAQGQYGCITQNTYEPGPTVPIVLTDREWALEMPVQTVTRFIAGFELVTRSAFGTAVVPTALYLSTGSQPLPTPAATASMSVGTTPNWYRTLFSHPIRIEAGTRFYLAFTVPAGAGINQSIAGSMSAASSRHFFRVNSSSLWTSDSDRWVFSVICSNAVDCAGLGLREQDWVQWTYRFFGNGRSSGGASVQTFVGNPAPCLRVQTNPEAGTNTGNALVAVWSTCPGYTWNPAAEGAIESVTLAVDCRRVLSPVADGQGLGKLAIQNGRFYVSYFYPQDITGRPQDWTRLVHTPRRAVDFYEIWPANLESHPDFSRNGAPITFGFLCWNTAITGGYSQANDYDNLNLTVQRGSPGGFEAYGAACAGVAGTPLIAGSGSPRVGGTVTVSVSPVYTADLTMLVLGVSNSQYLGLRLPFNFSPIGTPPCYLNASPDIILGGGGLRSLSFTIPANPGLVDQAAYLQWLIHEPTVSRIISTQGLAIFIGS
ncbi:MAG: hypothetical protein R3F56_08890 [Planctomycetota bacterium]